MRLCANVFIMETEQAPNDTRDAAPSQVPGRVRVLANGTLLDTETHRFLPGSKPTTAIQGSEDGRRLANRRQELAGKAARQALALKAQEQGLACSPVAAYGLLAGEAYDSALANMLDKPREAAEVSKLALRLAGMLPADDRQAQAVAAVQIVLAPEVARFIEGVWREGGEAEGGGE